MPAHRAANMSKAAVNKAVSKNIHELSHPNKKGRSHEQIVAIAESQARSKKKK